MSFRNIFYPTPEERIAQYEFLQKSCEDDGSCTNCVNYIKPDSNLPGYVLDLGDCKISEELFSERISKLKKCKCIWYEYNDQPKEILQNSINKLKERINI